MPNEGCVATDVVGIPYQAAPHRFGDVHMRASLVLPGRRFPGVGFGSRPGIAMRVEDSAICRLALSRRPPAAGMRSASLTAPRLQTTCEMPGGGFRRRSGGRVEARPGRPGGSASWKSGGADDGQESQSPERRSISTRSMAYPARRRRVLRSKNTLAGEAGAVPSDAPMRLGGG